MPTFSRSLEQSLHRALALANERHHEYATLEHLLLALIDDQDAAAVMRACNVDLDKLRRNLTAYVESELDNLIIDGGDELEADGGLPARDPACRDSCAVVRTRRGDGRQRAGRHLRRARKPCRVFPARAGHDAVRCGQLHQPRHRQARRHCRNRGPCAASTRKPTARAATIPRKRATRSRPIASTSTRRRARARSTR